METMLLVILPSTLVMADSNVAAPAAVVWFALLVCGGIIAGVAVAGLSVLAEKFLQNSSRK